MKRRALAAAIAAAASLAFTGPSLAWGDKGHETVGLIAEHYLRPEVRAQIIALLATRTDDLAPHDTGDVIADQATWADKYLDVDNRQAHYLQTRAWHFINLEIDGVDLRSACYGRMSAALSEPASLGPANSCVVDKIHQFERELADSRTAPTEKLLALRFLLHLAGDLHQPLHTADDHDQGGNQKHVVAQGLQPATLHRYWDVQFVDALGGSPDAIAQHLIAGITDAQAAQWSSGSLDDWAMETWGVAKQYAYAPLPAADAQGNYDLDAHYVADAQAVAAVQLSKAGVRLAVLLNHALADR